MIIAGITLHYRYITVTLPLRYRYNTVTLPLHQVMIIAGITAAAYDGVAK